MNTSRGGTAIAADPEAAPCPLAGLGARIRAARVRAGLSQAALGRAIGRELRHIQRYEADDTYPPLMVLAAIARTLDVRMAELLEHS
jgi:transcriptional regulator with XRE-family HTH domain